MKREIERDGVGSPGRMTGAVLGRPLLPLNGAGSAPVLLRRPDTKDVSSRRVALSNRLSITDLQPPLPPSPRTPQT